LIAGCMMDNIRKFGIASAVVLLASFAVLDWVSPFKYPDSIFFMILGPVVQVMAILSGIACIIFSIMMIVKKDHAYGIPIFLLTVLLWAMLLWPIKANI
jgi:hypothetical protein